MSNMKTPCPSTAAILRMVRAKDKVDDHVRKCPHCRAVFETFVRTENLKEKK